MYNSKDCNSETNNEKAITGSGSALGTGSDTDSESTQEKNNRWKQEYSLDTYPGGEYEAYGISITRFRKNGIINRQESSGPFTGNKDKALLIMDFLATYQTPPYQLVDMITEWESVETLGPSDPTGDRFRGQYRIGNKSGKCDIVSDEDLAKDFDESLNDDFE